MHNIAVYKCTNTYTISYNHNYSDTAKHYSCSAMVSYDYYLARVHAKHTTE